MKFAKNSANFIKNGFYNEPVYNANHLKTEIIFFEGKVNKIFIMIKYQKKVLIVFVYQWY